MSADDEIEPETAAAWLDRIRQAPEHTYALDDVRQILKRWPHDPALVTRVCDVLIRAAEQAPMDQQAPTGGPAQLAADAAEHCLAALAETGDAHVLLGYLHINRANALRLLHDYEAALPAFESALREQPDNGAWWFNLGLLHKASGTFGEGLAVNRKARELLGDRKPVLWNIAICATAIGDSKAAVSALRALGHDAKVATSGMPYVQALPPVQVRAATLGSGLGGESSLPERAVGFELLWVTPISPCHGVVSSPSFRQAAIDYGDVVLWDAVPLGASEQQGQRTPRFALLAILRKGNEQRFRFVALEQKAGQFAAWVEELPENIRCFVHEERVEMLCARCASGDSMRKHQHGPAEAHRLSYGKMVTTGDQDLHAWKGALDATLRRHPCVQVVVPGLLEALGDTRAAGQAHQMWLGLERTAQKRSAVDSASR